MLLGLAADAVWVFSAPPADASRSAWGIGASPGVDVGVALFVTRNRCIEAFISEHVLPPSMDLR